MVCDWCMDLMADWAICLAVNVTNAQPGREKQKVSQNSQCLDSKVTFLPAQIAITFTVCICVCLCGQTMMLQQQP